MNLSVGVMQGRLLPKFEGRYQAHPIGRWQREFELAAAEGLDYLEFILDLDRAEMNPLWTAEGRAEILAVSARTGVRVEAICADYFLEQPLWTRPESTDVMVRVLQAAREVGAGVVVLPVLEKATIPSKEALGTLRRCLQEALIAVQGPRIALETESSPDQTLELLSALNQARIGLAYDTGNLAAAGFDAPTDWSAYGDRVIHVHLKDRPVGGGSVPLGEGAVDFPGLFRSMSEFAYAGAVTIQGYRDDEGLAVFQRQHQTVRDWMSAHQPQEASP